MKPTGRTLTLRGVVNPNDFDSVTFGNVYANKFFDDDRIGYGWKVKSFNIMQGINSVRIREKFGLWTIDPHRLSVAQGIRMLGVEDAASQNQCIAVSSDLESSYGNFVLDPNHIIVDSLAIVAEVQDQIPYIVTIEEYQISNYEEIIQRVKETAQNVEGAN